MKKQQVLIIAFLILLSVSAFTSMQTKAQSGPTVSVSPISWTMNVGQTENFTAAASGGTGNYSSYQWNVSSTLQSETGPSFSFAPSSVGSYSITVTVTDNSSATSAPSAAVVKVNSALVAPTVTPIPVTVDQNQTSSLTSTAISTGTSPYTYQWLQQPPGAASYSSISGATTSSYSFVTSGATTAGSWSFELQVTDNASTPTMVTSRAASVTVNVAPTVSISPVGPLTLTAGKIQAFTATASGGTGTLSYHWYLDGAPVGSNSASYSYTAAAGSHSVTCTVTDSASTPITSPTSNAVSVTVKTTFVFGTIDLLIVIIVIIIVLILILLLWFKRRKPKTKQTGQTPQPPAPIPEASAEVSGPNPLSGATGSDEQENILNDEQAKSSVGEKSEATSQTPVPISEANAEAVAPSTLSSAAVNNEQGKAASDEQVKSSVSEKTEASPQSPSPISEATAEAGVANAMPSTSGSVEQNNILNVEPTKISNSEKSDPNMLQFEIDPISLDYLKKNGEVYLLTDFKNPQYTYYKIKGYDAKLNIEFKEFVEVCKTTADEENSPTEFTTLTYNAASPIDEKQKDLGFYLERSGFSTVNDWVKTLKEDDKIPECSTGRKTFYLYYIHTP